MQVLRDAWGRTDLPRGTVVTVGNYDGIHLGQQAVLDRVVERAAELGLSAVAVTFDPHPRTVLTPGVVVPALTTPRQKERLLAARGIDALVSVRFSPEFARTTAEEFVRRLLAVGLGAREIWVGEDFSFGRGREGNLRLLETLGPELGFRAIGVPKLAVEGEAISSTRIRSALARGDVEAARRMLGRAYALGGRIVHGDGRGRRIGWPTANLDSDNELLPLDGVYATGVRLQGADPLPGVANVGVRPTIGTGGERVAEVHLLDFDGDLYGRTAELLFCRRLREERRFPSLEALERQIGRDVEEAREYFTEYSCWCEGETDRKPPARRKTTNSGES